MALPCFSRNAINDHQPEFFRELLDKHGWYHFDRTISNRLAQFKSSIHQDTFKRQQLHIMSPNKSLPLGNSFGHYTSAPKVCSWCGAQSTKKWFYKTWFSPNIICLTCNEAARHRLGKVRTPDFEHIRTLHRDIQQAEKPAECPSCGRSSDKPKLIGSSISHRTWACRLCVHNVVHILELTRGIIRPHLKRPKPRAKQRPGRNGIYVATERVWPEERECENPHCDIKTDSTYNMEWKKVSIIELCWYCCKAEQRRRKMNLATADRDQTRKRAGQQRCPPKQICQLCESCDACLRVNVQDSSTNMAEYWVWACAKCVSAQHDRTAQHVQSIKTSNVASKSDHPFVPFTKFERSKATTTSLLKVRSLMINGCAIHARSMLENMMVLCQSLHASKVCTLPRPRRSG